MRRRGPIRAVGALIAAVGLVLGLGGPPAQARYMTGLALLDWCRDDGSTFCPGYLAALADYQSVLQRLDTETDRFCLPSNVKLAILREVTLRDLGAQPREQLSEVAARVMIPALARRFPAPAGDQPCPFTAAAYVTGNELLDWCLDDAARFCAGYVAALVDYQDELQRLDVATPRFCLAADAKLSDLHRLTVETLRANPPSEMRKLAASLVVPGLFRRYPCR
jgi:hypothetical protein